MTTKPEYIAQWKPTYEDLRQKVALGVTLSKKEMATWTVLKTKFKEYELGYVGGHAPDRDTTHAVVTNVDNPLYFAEAQVAERQKVAQARADTLAYQEEFRHVEDLQPGVSVSSIEEAAGSYGTAAEMLTALRATADVHAGTQSALSSAAALSVSGLSGLAAGGKPMGQSVVKQLLSAGQSILSGASKGGAIGAGASGLQAGMSMLGLSGGKGTKAKATSAFGGLRRHKRINPTNSKALRRAVRRLSSYHHLNVAVEKQLRHIAPRRHKT